MQMVATTLKSRLKNMQKNLNHAFDNLDSLVNVLKVQENLSPELLKCT